MENLQPRPDPVHIKDWEQVRASDELTVGVLLHLYNYQEPNEQYSGTTHVLNDCGFNRNDAGPMTDIAKFYLQRGYLTPNQLRFVQRAVIKYRRQFIGAQVRPMPIRKQEPKQTSPAKHADLNGDGQVRIKFTYDSDLVAKMKTLPGWAFDGKDKSWTCEVNDSVISSLKEWGFEIGPRLIEWQANQAETMAVVEQIVDGLDDRLYPFQKEGVKFIQAKNGRALIADEMGLGKTVEALAWLKLHPELRPAIVVCPAAVKLNWAKEAKKWLSASEQIKVLSGRTRADLPLKDIIITNFDIIISTLTTHEEKKDALKESLLAAKTDRERAAISSQYWNARLAELSALKPAVVILDEGHYIKNKQAQRTKAVQALGREVSYIIALTGTPIINRPVEFFVTLNLLMPKVFRSFWKFAHRYCAPCHNGFGWDFTGASNTKELHDLLTSTIMLRRLKADVLPDLPAKVRTVLPLELHSVAEYRAALEEYHAWLDEAEERGQEAIHLSQIEKLKQVATKGKLPQAVAWIEDWLETGGKLVAFTTHQFTVDALKAHFGDKAVVLDGRTPAGQRQEVVDRFQNDPSVRLFVGNVKAAGVGITLTAASACCFLELPWTPGECSQAEDRIHRIGQEADSVNAYYLVGEETVEEDIAKLLDSKQQVLSAILDGKDAEEESMLTALIKRMKKEKGEQE